MPIQVFIDGKRFKSLKSGLTTVSKRLNRALDKSGVPVSKELRLALNNVAAQMERQHGTAWRPGGSPARKLLRRSGAGLRGILSSVRVTGSRNLATVTGQIGAPFPMSVHEKGATIRAKRSKFLTIPLPAALDGRGIPLRRRARDWDNTFVQRSRRGNLLIFQKRGENIVPLYVLKRSVKLRPRLALGKTLTKELGFFRGRLIDALERELNKV